MIIVDIGAHNGTQFSIPFAEDINNIVYAIEPIPALAEQIRAHNLPNLHVFCLAMGDRNGTAQLHVNQLDETSSLLPAHCQGKWEPYAESLREVSTIAVDVKRLDTFLQENLITEIDLLKIDTQGYDLNVLVGAGETLHSIKRILLEVQLTPLYEGGASKDDIVTYLTNRGFRLLRSSLQTGGLEENLEFMRVHRYPLTQPNAQYFDVKVPYIGTLSLPKDDLVGKLLEQGVFEGPEQAFLWLYLREDDVFWDCGAHAGLFSAIAAKRLANRGSIVGFEPHPLCFQLYQHNLKQLNCDCFTAFNVGLSDSPGSADLLLGKSGMSAFSTLALGAASHGEIGQETIAVELRSIDQVIFELGCDQVALAKLDVEGWENFVLQGASAAIQAHKFPLWMIEFTEENAVAAGSSTQALRSLLESFGYSLCRFDATRLQLVPEPYRPTYAYANLFAALDIQAVNERLARAEPQFVEIAQDLVNQWDRAVNADQIHPLLQICEADRATRLQMIDQLSQQLQTSETDRAARLTLIDQLSQQLQESEADRAARLTLIEQISQQLQESEADRAARLTLIEQISQQLEQVSEQLQQCQAQHSDET